jgi:hypothetical protein
MEKDFDDKKYQVQMMTGWRTFACFTSAKVLALLVTKYLQNISTTGNTKRKG